MTYQFEQPASKVEEYLYGIYKHNLKVMWENEYEGCMALGVIQALHTTVCGASFTDEWSVYDNHTTYARLEEVLLELLDENSCKRIRKQGLENVVAKLLQVLTMAMEDRAPFALLERAKEQQKKTNFLRRK